jgi:hypothetical protein
LFSMNARRPESYSAAADRMRSALGGVAGASESCALAMLDEKIAVAAKPNTIDRRDHNLTSFPFRFVLAQMNADERDCDSPYFTLK